MKNTYLAMGVAVALGFASQATAAGDQQQNASQPGLSSLALLEQTTAGSSMGISDLVSMVSSNLDVSEAQSEGGLASIFNYAKGNLSSTDFSQLSDSIPGLSSIMDKVPDIGGGSESGSSGMSGLLDKAAEYSDSMGSISELNKQFESLGLTPDMISSYVTQISNFLDTEQGQQAKELLKSGLGKLMG